MRRGALLSVIIINFTFALCVCSRPRKLLKSQLQDVRFLRHDDFCALSLYKRRLALAMLEFWGKSNTLFGKQ